MEMAKLILNRDVDMGECHWLERDYKEGELVFDYTGYTYGCCTDSGVPVSEIEDASPFFELPADAVDRSL